MKEDKKIRKMSFHNIPLLHLHFRHEKDSSPGTSKTHLIYKLLLHFMVLCRLFKLIFYKFNYNFCHFFTDR